MQNSLLRKLFFWGGTVCAIGILGIVAVVDVVTKETVAYRTTDLVSVPETRVAIIFGAHVLGNGQPSPILGDRVDAGVALYKAGKVKKLLMSGDNRFVDYNEVAVMQAYAVEHGVPKEDIVLDYAGRSTYDTCYRAKHIFGLDSAVLVTQRYHSPRAVYTCRGLGIDAVGYMVNDFDKYPDLLIPYTSREILATVNAWIELHITHPKAEVLGNKEPVI
jgi:vancomycin permeability regulator SanA